MFSVRNQLENYFFKSVLTIGFGLSVLIVVFIGFLLNAGREFMSATEIMSVLTTSLWFPSEGLYGLLPMIVGSFLVSALALLIAGPLALVLAFFSFYMAPPLIKSIVNICMDVFLAIPSVVFGLWGLVVLVPLLAPLFPPGQGVLTASVLLSFMILPIGFKVFLATFQTVPHSWLLATKTNNLGAWSVFSDIILKNYYKDFFVGFLMQVTRALGETIAVLMVCGNIIQLPSSLFAPVRTLTTNIALEMAYAVDVHRSSLFFSALVLIVFIFLLLLAVKNKRLVTGEE